MLTHHLHCRHLCIWAWQQASEMCHTEQDVGTGIAWNTRRARLFSAPAPHRPLTADPSPPALSAAPSAPPPQRRPAPPLGPAPPSRTTWLVRRSAAAAQAPCALPLPGRAWGSGGKWRRPERGRAGAGGAEREDGGGERLPEVRHRGKPGWKGDASWCHDGGGEGAGPSTRPRRGSVRSPPGRLRTARPAAPLAARSSAGPRGPASLPVPLPARRVRGPERRQRPRLCLSALSGPASPPLPSPVPFLLSLPPRRGSRGAGALLGAASRRSWCGAGAPAAEGLPPVPLRPSRARGLEIAAAPGFAGFCPAPLCTGVTTAFLEKLGELCR